MRNRQLGLILMLLAILILHQPLKVNASSLGISGSFGQTSFLMVPGERFSDPSVQVIVFNPSSQDLTIRLSGTGPTGVRFRFDKEVIIVKRLGRVKIPVRFDLLESVEPGIASITVTATIVSASSGIAVSGFVSLSAPLTVMGEAGRLRVIVRDVRNQPFDAMIRIERILDSGTATPCATTETGTYNGRLVPGTYRISAWVDQTEVASQTVTLKDKDDLEVILIARMIRFPLFLAAPVFDSQGQLKNAGLAYSITNLGDRETNVSLQVLIEKDGKRLEQSEALTIPILDPGTLSGRLTVVPPNGFQNGVYAFGLVLISEDGIVLAQSEPQGFAVKIKTSTSWPNALWLITGLAGLWWVMKRKKRPS